MFRVLSMDRSSDVGRHGNQPTAGLKHSLLFDQKREGVMNMFNNMAGCDRIERILGKPGRSQIAMSHVETARPR